MPPDLGTPAKVERNAEIHRRWRYGESQKDLAAEFGISASRVFQICHKVDRQLRKAWSVRPRIVDPDFPKQEYKGHWIGGMTLGEDHASR